MPGSTRNVGCDFPTGAIVLSNKATVNIGQLMAALGALCSMAVALTGCFAQEPAADRVRGRVEIERAHLAGTAAATTREEPPALNAAVRQAQVLVPTVERLSEQEAVQRVLPAVVRISTTASTGSGVFLGHDGTVITNAHVVGRSRVVDVTLRDGTTRQGVVERADDTADLALLRVPGVEHVSAKLGDADLLQLGEPLLAIGYALGLRGEPSITRGIFSGMRSFTEGDYLQTDAAINPGNSGGPLLSMKGEVVGINAWIIRSRGGVNVQGVNFAISADAVRGFLAARDLSPVASAPARPSASVVPRSLSPSATVAQYYRLLNARDYVVAYGLMSDGLRASSSLDVFKGWFVNKISIRLDEIEVESVSGDTAEVAAVVTSTDRLSGSPVTARYRERWHLVSDIVAVWRLDSVGTRRIS